MSEIKQGTTNKLDVLLREEFQANVQTDLEGILSTDDTKRAYELSNMLGDVYQKHKTGLQEYSGLVDFYRKVIVQARFVALPLLDENDAVGLLQNYFSWHFSIPNYNIFEKFKAKLLFMPVYEERDAFKTRLKHALEESGDRIVSGPEQKSIKVWLRDYISRLGLEVANNLERRQYFIEIKNRQDLKGDDWERLKILFDFYEKLKISSLTPGGFEEDVPITLDGKFYIFKQGELEEIKADVGGKDLGVPKTKGEREVEKLKQDAEQYQAGTLERMAVEEEISQKERIEELRIEANKHDEGSLERQAIEEEIKKLESNRS